MRIIVYAIFLLAITIVTPAYAEDISIFKAFFCNADNENDRCLFKNSIRNRCNGSNVCEFVSSPEKHCGSDGAKAKLEVQLYTSAPVVL